MVQWVRMFAAQLQGPKFSSLVLMSKGECCCMFPGSGEGMKGGRGQTGDFFSLLAASLAENGVAPGLSRAPVSIERTEMGT